MEFFHFSRYFMDATICFNFIANNWKERLVTTFHIEDMYLQHFKILFMIIIISRSFKHMKHSTHSLICFWLISISTHVCSHRTRASVHKSLIFCQIWDLFNQRKFVCWMRKKIRKETRLSLTHSLTLFFFLRLTTTTSVFRCVLLFFTYRVERIVVSLYLWQHITHSKPRIWGL